MSQAIASSVIPPVPGLESEEPEQAYEDDIPKEDAIAPQEPPLQERPLRDVERE